MKAQLVISHRPCVKPAYSSRNACINRLLTEKYSYLLKTSICVCVSVCIRQVHTGRNKTCKAFQRGETVRRGLAFRDCKSPRGTHLILRCVPPGVSQLGATPNRPSRRHSDSHSHTNKHRQTHTNTSISVPKPSSHTY